jgi:hypothetical protein
MAYTQENTSPNFSTEEVVFYGVLKILDSIDDQIWFGSMTDLNADLVRVLKKDSVALLPRSPSALRVVLNRLVHRIRNRGVSVKFGKTNGTNSMRYVKFVTRY